MKNSEKELRNQKNDNKYVAEVNKLSNDEKQEIENLWREYGDARKCFEKDYNLYSGMTTDFQEQLKKIVKEKKKTYEEVANAVSIRSQTLARYNHGHNAPSMTTLIAICMVLSLDVKQSTALLTTLGLCFLGTSREHYAYLLLIEKYRGASIEKCNEILTGLHIYKKYQLYPRKKVDNS